MSDPDGDSHMHSSSSDEADSEAMFPAELEPPGSGLHNRNSLDSPSLLAATNTPPQSQDFEQAMDTESSNYMLSESGVTHAMQRDLGHGHKSDLAKSAEGQQEPGAAWNNKKAREEYQRAAMQIEDKNFSLREFGDPFDESDQSQDNARQSSRQG